MPEQTQTVKPLASNTKRFRIIRQPYRITMARWRFTVLQKRILTRIISAMQREIASIEKGTPIEQLRLFMTSENTIELTIPLNGLVKNSNNYTSVKKALQQLRKLDVEICLPHVKGSKNMPEQELILTGLIERVVMRKHSRTITLTMHKATAAELVKVSHGLTCFSEEIMFMTDNPYTQKIYEIICHWKDKSVFTFSIDQFRKRLMLENKYPLTKDIVKHIIRPAEKELQEIGDIFFVFSPTKAGKTITHFNFAIKNRVSQKQEEQANIKVREQLVNILRIRFGFKEDQFQQIMPILDNPLNLRPLNLKVAELWQKLDEKREGIYSPAQWAVASLLNVF